jgi:ABC-type nitrate/sulfonate/bicarbonate transport system substrate-binding protein
MPENLVSRRAFLSAIGAVGATAMLGACSSKGSLSGASASASAAGVSTGSSAAAVSGASSAASAPAAIVKLPVALSFSPNVEYGGNWLADAQGMYRKAGVAPTFQAGGPNAPAPEVALSSGNSLIATESNSVRLFTYLSKQQDLVIIGSEFQKSPNGLLSLAKHPVKTAADLHGVKILAGAANRPNMTALMKINNVSDWTFVPAGADVGALMAGQGDALLAFSNNQPITLAQQYHMTEGKDYFFTFFSDLNYNLCSELFLVSRSYLDAHRDVVVNYMKATAQGYEAFIKNPDQAAQLAVDKYGASLGLNLAQQKASAEAEVPLIQSDLTRTKGLLTVDVDYIENKVYPTMRASGIENLPDISKIVDTTVLADVYKDGPTV